MVVRSLYLWILVYSTLCFSTLENNFVSTTLRDPWAKVSTECSSSTLKDYSNSSKLPTRHTGIQEFHVSLLFLGARLPHNCLVPSDATCQRTRKQLDTRSVSLPVCKQHLRTVETALDSFESIVRPSSNSTLSNNKYSCYFVHVLPTCVYFALFSQITFRALCFSDSSFILPWRIVVILITDMSFPTSSNSIQEEYNNNLFYF